jgi:hypothetical protein
MNKELISLFQSVESKVIQVTGVNQLFNTNQEEAVDARTILIYILSEKGLTDTQIAALTNLTRQGVNKLKNSVRYRKNKFSFISDMQQIRNEL